MFDSCMLFELYELYNQDENDLFERLILDHERDCFQN